MAKKPRTPDPPRKVQAPKVRQKPRPDSGGGFATPSTNVLIGVGLAASVALAVGLIVVLTGSAGASNVSAEDVTKVRTAMTAAGCTFTGQPASASQRHMQTGDQRVVYDTFPASSGVHNPSTSIFGNYRLPVDPRQAVHNLEHGAIAIWYGPDISVKDRVALDELYDDDPNGLIISPIRDPYPRVKYPKHEPLDSGIALTTWTAPADEAANGTVYVARCPSFDREALAAFRDTFRGKGPERFPVSQMVPGGN
ncbi:MAG TPA: DUF3105 domain-containing protein [Gaiellaceae bacterium]|nr:DUF3105 domain-containing protein [Gaiellaceae bacterium]